MSTRADLTARLAERAALTQTRTVVRAASTEDVPRLLELFGALADELTSLRLDGEALSRFAAEHPDRH
jgi:hypothetical protein